MTKETKFSASTSSLSIDAIGQKVHLINKNDWISKLPDDVLHTILSKLSTEEAVKTSLLARRWVELWKYRPSLELDMRKLRDTTCPLYDASVEFARSMTKVIKEHCGDLESCLIHYYILPRCLTGKLESWIDTVIRVKHTKDLTVVNQPIGRTTRYSSYHSLYLVQDNVLHQSLTSLSLQHFWLFSTHAFNNFFGLKILKLLDIFITEVGVLTRVFAACSSLEVIVFEVSCYVQSGVLKIVNNNLKFLKVTLHSTIDKMQVHASCLHVLDVQFIRVERDDVILDAPNIQFNRNYWIAHGFPNAHMSYDISTLAQEKTNVWHELMVSDMVDARHGSLSVRVDMTNPVEVKILKDVLLMWSDEMKELEILFKNNIAEGEESEPLWETTKSFPNADFRVHTAWIYNFSGSIKEEIALVWCFVTQETVAKILMIETSKFSPMKKLKVEADVAKLMEDTKGKEDFSLGFF